MSNRPLAQVGIVRAAIFLIAVGVADLPAANPYYDPNKPHHTPDGFRNHYAGTVTKGFSDLLRWQWESWREGLPKPAQTPTPQVAPYLPRIQGYVRTAPDSAAGQSASPPAISWLGHASLLVQAGGLNVLTDPIFSERASPVQLFGPKRVVAPGVPLESLPPVDVVIISHNHYDHLDRASIVALHQKAMAEGGRTLFLVPLGLKPWFEALGVDSVVELDWWQQHSVRGVDFVLTPVQHWSARGVADRSTTLWGGWAVLGRDLHWYFGGDTGYSKDFADTRLRLANRQTEALGGGFDVALLPIGAYAPRWFMREQHVNPDEAVQMHLDLGAKQSIGMHWGTFALTDEPLDQPPQDLVLARRALKVPEDRFSVMAVGETRAIPPRSSVKN